MKNHLILIFTIFLYISCRKPVDPVVEEPTDPVEDLLIYNHWDTFNTGGYCLDLDISDSILVAAARYNGYFIFSIDEDNRTLDTIYHANNLDPEVATDRADRVIISKEHDIVFILDKYDKIYLYRLNGNQYEGFEDGANYTDFCSYNVWISLAIEDREEGIGIFSLVKHNSAEEENVDGFVEESTSLVWSNLTETYLGPDIIFSAHTPYEYTYNFTILPTEIYYSHELLSVANGELGVLVLKKTNQDVCVPQSGDMYEPENMSECEELDGSFELAGGFIPSIFSSFDTPGEVKTVYSYENTIFAGLSTSNGCLIQDIGEDGELLNHYLIAEGFSVNGIHYDNDLLALACGHDGVIIYQWDGAGLPIFLGRIATSYANKIKVNNNKVFVATEDGIDIFEIGR